MALTIKQMIMVINLIVLYYNLEELLLAREMKKGRGKHAL
ncbi:hypothetical protein HMPREF0201_03052 [Cedecea davisae DSM 4568]|uniref:Uncharacterized protein n=1 Tax=Cedecea davisae DSM 4568 TaxID=566551 RepID=S3J740_9ENTR|nr:hypothetical protein HMPREF0201_03052 [Cedecea davisae DSM 4568]